VPGGVGRRLTGPLRDYFNQHFEMVKDEVRTTAASGGAATSADTAAWERVAELENALAELSVHQTHAIGRLSDEVAALGERVADLERIVAQVADVVAAAFTREP